MKNLRKFLFGLTLLLILLAGVGLLLPASWKVERAILIQATPTVIYPLVADFKNGWEKWSEFAYEDPGTRYAYQGPEQGAGAQRTWVSKKQGSMTQKIMSADPAVGVIFELVMEDTEFVILGKVAFESTEVGATIVRWTDMGEVGTNFLYRYVILFMEKMTGKKLQKSLWMLKQHAEARA